MIAPVGFITGLAPLKGLGLAWMISPLPIVFSDTNGFEAFAAKFSMTFTLPDGSEISKPITFREAANLRGPYNRRNVYGAIIGYAPRLPISMVQSGLHFGICKTKTLLKEFDLPESVRKAELHIYDGTRGRDANTYHFEVVCNR